MMGPLTPSVATTAVASALSLTEEQRIALAIQLANSITDTGQAFGLTRLSNAARAVADDLTLTARNREMMK